MHYTTRPGVMRVKVCDVFLLVPNRKAFEFCHGVLPLGLMGGFTWGFVEKNLPLEDIYKMNRILTKKPEDEVRQNVDSFLSMLCEKGYLIPVEDEE